MAVARELRDYWECGRLPAGYEEVWRWKRQLCGLDWVVGRSLSLGQAELGSLLFPVFLMEGPDRPSDLAELVASLTGVESSPSDEVMQKELVSLYKDRMKELLLFWTETKNLQAAWHCLFHARALSSISEAAWGRQMSSATENLMLLISLPTRLSNIFREETPTEFTPSHFVGNLLSQFDFIASSQTILQEWAVIFHTLGRLISCYPEQSEFSLCG